MIIKKQAQELKLAKQKSGLMQVSVLMATAANLCNAHAGGKLETVGNLPVIAITATASEPEQSNTQQLGIANSASQGTITQAQLATRPLLRPAEVLETIPGLIVTQHSGDGKANQYFLRGFNLDHGTDFATSFEDVPINMVSHAHGQGYTDLNFLIPELIDSINYHKGATDSRDGDFASAGSAKIHALRRIDQNFIQLTGGSNQYQRLLSAGSAPLAQGNVLGALELMRNDGPWQNPENLKKENLLLSYQQGTLQNGWSLLASHYQSDWNATDQIAKRAADTGLVARFGSLDDSTGGKTQRSTLAFNQQISNANHHTALSAYAVDYRLNLFSNFTYFLTDPLRGDQFEQQDRRQILGGKIEHSRTNEWQGRQMVNTVGTSLRYDHISDLGLYQTQQRQRFATIRQDQVKQTAVALYAENQLQWLPWLKSVVGLRADAYYFDVKSDRAANSGSVNDQIVSPKLNLIFGPWQNTEYYLSYGYGFHSNDARGTTTRINPDPRDSAYLETVDPVSPLVRTKNAEIGLRTELIDNLHTTLSFWQLDSDSELLFVGDAGTTEASRPSRRQGIELTHYYQPNPDWMIDIDAAWSRARFKDSDPAGAYIPNAIVSTASAGISYQPEQSKQAGWSAGLRLRYFGSRPLLEDNSLRSSPSTLVNLNTGYRFNSQMSAHLDVLNLFDRKVNDIEYLYASCLKQEQTDSACSPLAAEREGITDRHLHPTEPRTYRLTLKYLF